MAFEKALHHEPEIQAWLDRYRRTRFAEVDSLQTELSQRYIEPHRATWQKMAQQIRRDIDEVMRDTKPRYPIGYCYQLTAVTLQQLRDTIRAPQNKDEQLVRDFRVFKKLGGVVRQVWGVQHEKYFQNSIQIGSWNLDVANDTVDPARDSVELQPFAESGMRNVNSFEDYGTIAERYWRSSIFRNTYFPILSISFPLLVVQPGGVIEFPEESSVQWLNMQDRLQPALQALDSYASRPAPDALIDFLAKKFPARELAEAQQPRHTGFEYFDPAGAPISRIATIKNGLLDLPARQRLAILDTIGHTVQNLRITIPAKLMQELVATEHIAEPKPHQRAAWVE